VASQSVQHFTPKRIAAIGSDVASAYDEAGVDYLAYADGTARDLFDFDLRYAFADRRIWAVIDARLIAFARSGRETLTVLDAGCGPGTWLLRVIARAQELGIAKIDARGFDISGEQIAIARMRSADVRSKFDIRCRFKQGDIAEPFSEETASVDLCLCLNGVLNHVDVARHMAVAAELARVTAGALILNVRSAGSTPSIFIDAIENAEGYRQDNGANRLTFDLKDGRHIEFGLHLFRGRELEALFDTSMTVTNLVGLDLCHSRFRPDPRWNPTEGPECDQFYHDLEVLEHEHSANRDFIDHATHILMVAEPECLPECRCEK
jgi:SAM-dependent methyltransferase